MTELHSKDEFLSFLPEQARATQAVSEPWNVLVVDDESSVQEVTRFALKDLMFEGRNLQFHTALSAKAALDFLQSGLYVLHVVLLDIVMEHRRAGLEVVSYLRNEQKDTFTQIVVRTGNPGLIQEDYLIHHYEVNAYEEKNTLTAQRLKTSLITALRAYKNMEAIQQLMMQKVAEAEGLRQTLRSVTFAPEQSTRGRQPIETLISLPVFLRQSHPPSRPNSAYFPAPDMPDIGLSLQHIQEKIAATSRKAIAIFDYNTYNYRYVSDNIEEITSLSREDLLGKLRGGHFTPDMPKIDKINKWIQKAYSETPVQGQKAFTAIFDYRVTPVAPHNTRILEQITPLLFSHEGDLLLSLHVFSNINHLKKADSNSILAVHKTEQHQYFSISDYLIEEIFFGQREQEIIELSDKNLSSKEIAAQINLSVHTVDTHLRNLRDRLGVSNTNALISYSKAITHLFS